ncbi:MAG: c-type cytochrome biogenesis protein CcsB [Actinomycetes bacterium]
MSSRSYAYLSNYSIYSAMVLVTIAFFAYATEVAFSMKNNDENDKTDFDFTRTTKSGRIGSIMMLLALFFLFGGVLFRALSAHRVPWGNMYEFSITGAFAVTGAYIFGVIRYRLRWLGLPISFAVLLTLGTAVTVLYRPSAPLVPALKSTWLAIHVSAAIISGGVFLLANAVAATYLILDNIEKKGPRPTWALRLPTLEALDQLSYRLVAFVFPLWTFAVIAGAIWAESAWGRYWGWDPKETWAFITWVAYAAYLHARVTIGWRGRRAAWLCLFAGSTFLFNYVYVNIWGTGRHTYSGL